MSCETCSTCGRGEPIPGGSFISCGLDLIAVHPLASCRWYLAEQPEEEQPKEDPATRRIQIGPLDV